jgi:glycolate oxidase FAD binding subunit
MMTGEQTIALRAASVEDVQAAVRAHARLRPVAGRSKPALSASAAPSAASAQSAAPQLLDVSALTGVLEYQPAECTFTARAATTIAEIERMLAADGLYLPFEPPLADAGATLGGTVAAGLSGPGRFRYGGVRDFLLGVQFVDGEGRVLRGGGKVVKNAAGFSLQHAFLGSLGRLAVMTEVTFKVFPRAPSMLTVALEFDTFTRALDALVKLRRSTFELEAVDLLPSATLVVRLGGLDEMLKARAAALVSFLMPGEVNLLPQAEADQEWHGARHFKWLDGSGHPLVKVAITPGRIVKFEERLAAAVSERVPRRYSAGGEVAWIGWPGTIDALDRVLKECELSGLVLTLGAGAGTVAGSAASPLIGVPSDAVFAGRLREAFDPRGIFA